MLEYDFVPLELDLDGYSFFGGAGIVVKGHQQLIRSRAKNGWTYAGFLPTKQRAGGFINEIELIFCRDFPDQE